MPEMTSTLPEGQRAGILPILLPETLREGPPRSRCAEIGYLICPRTNIVIQDESSIEHHCILFCYSDPSIERVFTNSARIRYTNEADEVHHHTLDIRAKRFDGYIYGLLAKPDSRAVSIDLRTFTKRLSRNPRWCMRRVPTTEQTTRTPKSQK